MALARVNRLWLDKVVDKSKQPQWWVYQESRFYSLTDIKFTLEPSKGRQLVQFYPREQQVL